MIKCAIPFQNMVIDADGTVTPCPYIICDYRFPNVLGNVNEKSILEIWNDEPYQKLREYMYSKEGANGCNNCLCIKQLSQNNIYEPFVPEHLKDKFEDIPAWQNYKTLLDDIEKKRTILNAKPSIISYTSSHSCNFRCIMCYQEHVRDVVMENEQKKDIELIELLPYISQLTAGGGEPFIQPIWKKFINGNTENYKLLTFAVTTNGAYLNDEAISKLSKFAKVSISVSYDATYKELFEKIRVHSNFETVNRNLLNAIDYMHRNSRDIFDVSASMTVMKENFFDVINMLEFMINNNFYMNFSSVSEYPMCNSLTAFTIDEENVCTLKELKIESEKIKKYLEKDFFNLPIYNLIKNHVTSLMDAIPFHLLDEKHTVLHTKVPSIYFNSILSNYGETDYIIAFAKIENKKIGKSHWYSNIKENGEFSVNLPDGDYATYVGKWNKGVAPNTLYLTAKVKNNKIKLKVTDKSLSFIEQMKTKIIKFLKGT